MIDYRVYLVTDDPSRYPGDWLDNVMAAVDGGVTCVQYRDTENPPKRQYERILRLKDALRRTDVALVVNNDAELAKAVGAHGVHVGQGDMPPPSVRAIVGPGTEIGFSITNRDQAADFCTSANRRAVDSLGLGPVYDASKTKVDAAKALGPVEFRGLVALLRSEGVACPLVAIGGITLENASDVLAAGADGLAVVSAFSKSEDPYDIARHFALLSDNRRL